MQIFSPAEAKSAAEKREREDTNRAHLIARATQELLLEQKNAEDTFAATLEEQRKTFEREIESEIAQRRELEQEVLKLERRRKEALSPLLVNARDVTSLEEVLHAAEEKLRERQERLDEEARILMKRLDDVATREMDASDKEKSVRRQQAAASVQIQTSKEQLKDLDSRMELFIAQSAARERSVEQKEQRLYELERIAKEREEATLKNSEKIEAARLLLAEDRILLEQQRQVVQEKAKGEEKRLSIVLKEIAAYEKELQKTKAESKKEHEKASKGVTALNNKKAQLQNAWSDFNELKDSQEEALAFQKSQLDATAKLQQEKELGFKKRELDLQDERVRINDQRLQLEKGFEELRKLKVKHK